MKTICKFFLDRFIYDMPCHDAIHNLRIELKKVYVDLTMLSTIEFYIKISRQL